jgi:hypothetical protein
MTTESEKSLEAEIRERGLNAPRLQPSDIDAMILTSQFHVFPGTVHTVCCLTLTNGFTVIGESAPVSVENFNQTIGEKAALDSARKKIWMLEGYRLKQDLHRISLLRQKTPSRD